MLRAKSIKIRALAFALKKGALSMKKTVYALLFSLALLFAGCQASSGLSSDDFSLPEDSVPEQSISLPAEESSFIFSSPEESSSSSPPEENVSVASSPGESAGERNNASFQSPYDMTYEEYFSEERYFNPGSPWNVLYSRGYNEGERDIIYRHLANGEDEVYYQHTAPIESCTSNDRYLLYFLSEGTVYRFFIPEKKVEKMFTTDERIHGLAPLTNFAFYYSIYNPQNDGVDPETNRFFPHFSHIFSVTGGGSRPFSPEDYPCSNPVFLLHSEEGMKMLYPLPEQ